MLAVGMGGSFWSCGAGVPQEIGGVDYSSRAIGYANAMVSDVEWVCGDIRDPQVVDARFDVVTLVETLEHIKPSEIHDFLSGVNRRLANDGTFVVTVPSRNVRVSRKHYQHFDLESLAGPQSVRHDCRRPLSEPEEWRLLWDSSRRFCRISCSS